MRKWSKMKTVDAVKQRGQRNLSFLDGDASWNFVYLRYPVIVSHVVHC